MKPYCIASTALARTQPLVVSPQISTLSIPAAVNVAARLVPKKALAYCLVTTVSPAAGVTSAAKAACAG